MILEQLLPWFQDDGAGCAGGSSLACQRVLGSCCKHCQTLLFQPLHERGSVEGLGSVIISGKMKYWIHLGGIMGYPKERRFWDGTFCSLAVFYVFCGSLEGGFENQGSSGKTMKMKCGGERGKPSWGCAVQAQHLGSMNIVDPSNSGYSMIL